MSVLEAYALLKSSEKGSAAYNLALETIGNFIKIALAEFGRKCCNE